MIIPGDCPDCGGKLTEAPGDSNERICKECGLVNPVANQTENEIQFAIDKERSEETEEIKSGWKNQVVVEDSSDQNLVEFLATVDEYVQQLEFDKDAQIRIAELVIASWERNLFHGRSEEALVAGCAYAASRELGCPRPLTIVSETASMSESKLNRSYRTLTTELGVTIPVTAPEGYLGYLRHRMGLPKRAGDEAKEILKTDEDYKGNPAGLAAAALYLAGKICGQDVTLSEAGRAAGVAKETVWRNVQMLKD